MTSREGVFAGGDVTTGPSTVIQCVANGHAAARGIARYLNVTLVTGEMAATEERALLHFDKSGVAIKEGLRLAELPIAERSIEREDEIAPDLAAALSEAKRCMNCGCYAVQPSDIAPVLVAMSAGIKTTQRELSAEEFCCSELKVSDVLRSGEIVTGILLRSSAGKTAAYRKFRLRDSIDFAMYSLASVIATKDGMYADVKLVLGGVAPLPYVLTEVADWLRGKPVNANTAEQAAELAVRDAFSMGHNEYKIVGIKQMICDALLAK
jgi:CO/xanthine dehydrogenase FAD-binding subunit